MCRWWRSDTPANRKSMQKSFLAIIFLNFLRYLWILAGSWAIFGTSVDWYMMTQSRDLTNDLQADWLKNKVNDRFVTRFVIELVVLTLLYWYCWQLAQRYSIKMRQSDSSQEYQVAERRGPPLGSVNGV